MENLEAKRVDNENNIRNNGNIWHILYIVNAYHVIVIKL